MCCLECSAWGDIWVWCTLGSWEENVKSWSWKGKLADCWKIPWPMLITPAHRDHFLPISSSLFFGLYLLIFPSFFSSRSFLCQGLWPLNFPDSLGVCITVHGFWLLGHTTPVSLSGVNCLSIAGLHTALFSPYRDYESRYLSRIIFCPWNILACYMLW